MLLRATLVKLVKWIGFSAYSKENLYLANAIFFAYFFNTTVVLIICYADFSHFPLIAGMFNHGLFPDYTANWYNVVGEIIVTTESLRWILPLVIESILMLVNYVK